MPFPLTSKMLLRLAVTKVAYVGRVCTQLTGTRTRALTDNMLGNCLLSGCRLQTKLDGE